MSKCDLNDDGLKACPKCGSTLWELKYWDHHLQQAIVTIDGDDYVESDDDHEDPSYYSDEGPSVGNAHSLQCTDCGEVFPDPHGQDERSEEFWLWEEQDCKASGKIRIDGATSQVLLFLKGFGNVGSPEAPIISLELHEGQPRLLVFADHGNEAPTHVIDLSGAREVKS